MKGDDFQMDEMNMDFSQHSQALNLQNSKNLMSDMMTLQMVSQAILDLKHAPGWSHFVQAVERLMAGCDLKTLAIQDEADLLRISTRQFYKKGLQDALNLVERQEEVLRSIQQQVSQQQVSEGDV